MSVGERWRRVALIKAALAELSAHVPEIEQTKREIEQVKRLAVLMQDCVTKGVQNNPATFLLACDLLGVDPFKVRQALRI